MKKYYNKRHKMNISQKKLQILIDFATIYIDFFNKKI